MKNALLLSLLISPFLMAQEGPIGGPYHFNSENVNCLSEEKTTEIKNRIVSAKEALAAQGRLPRNAAGIIPSYRWPVAKNPAAPYNNVWAISNYVDHNAAYPNQVQDWNCGSRTYDTSAGYNHKGVDIFTWPFTWYQMANNQSWAVAAAPGTILMKDNGYNDTSCSMNGGNWNAVYLAHSDGSVTWYGHLKNNSLTTKAVGETVEVGEFLGVIGSSGNSTGPHLHFEVYNGANQLVDPYAGPCNNWLSSNTSWWETQKPYQEPKVNAVFTHHAAPVFPSCPQIETPNFKNEFEVGESVICAGYFADQLANEQVRINLYKPDGALAYSNYATSPTNYNASYWYWIFNSSFLDQTGIWTVTFTLSGQTLSHDFAYGVTMGTNEDATPTELVIYPNPAQVQIYFSLPVNSVSAYSIDGKIIPLQLEGSKADVSQLPSGVFLLRGQDNQGRFFTRKLVK